MNKLFVPVGMKRAFATLATASFVSSAALGAQLNVPADHFTIQQAINEAASGDTVLVAPGVYQESIDFLGKDIVVLSDAGPAVTIIDPLQTNWVARIVGAVGRSARLEGFTLRNGSPGVVIGGGAAVTIINNRIISNFACSGAGMTIIGSSPLVLSNLIAGNFSNGFSGCGAGGIYVGGVGGAEIVGNVITNNFNGQVVFNSGGAPIASAPLLQGNVIGWGTNGAGIGFFNGFNGIIVNNLILENAGSGISGVVPANSQSPVIVNNTLVANRDSGIAIGGSSGATIIANNIVVAFSNHVATGSTLPMMWNNNFYSAGAAFAGLGPNPIGVQGNISVDPNFVDSSNSDYRLKANSLLINSGDNRHLPSTVTNDFEKSIRIRGKTVDMGAYEFQSPTSDISYHWLQANGLSRDGSSDYTDPDGDGMNNWQEWRSDTVPTNALSVFRIVDVKSQNRRRSVTWISGVNRSYVLERSIDLSKAGYSIVRSNLAGATNMTTFLDGSASSPGAFFYRVSTP